MGLGAGVGGGGGKGAAAVCTAAGGVGFGSIGLAGANFGRVESGCTLTCAGAAVIGLSGGDIGAPALDAGAGTGGVVWGGGFEGADGLTSALAASDGAEVGLGCPGLMIGGASLTAVGTGFGSAFAVSGAFVGGRGCSALTAGIASLAGGGLSTGETGSAGIFSSACVADHKKRV